MPAVNLQYESKKLETFITFNFNTQPLSSRVPALATAVQKMNDLSSDSVLPSLNYLSGHLSASRFLPFKIPERFNQSNSIQDPPSKLIPKIIDETPCLVGLEEIESEVRSVLVRTVSENEGNVLLLSGPRGSGKTTVISRSLSLLSHPRLYGSNGFITIKLNGFVHTNDKLALKDMARQLLTSLQDQEKKKVIGKILDQDQEDLDSDNQPEQDIPRFTNYGETLKNLLEVLEPQPSFSRDQGPKSKALVIILEEFDLFAELDRQAFLYCLLDAVQGNKRRGGLCIIGTTVVVDCLDRLEKRVKSRCQSRIRYLNCPTTDEEQIELLRSVLEIPIGIFSTELFTQQWNEDLERFLKEKKVQEWIKNQFDLISEAVVPILQELNTIVSRVAYERQQKGTIQFPALKSSELFERNSLPWWC